MRRYRLLLCLACVAGCAITAVTRAAAQDAAASAPANAFSPPSAPPASAHTTEAQAADGGFNFGEALREYGQPLTSDQAASLAVASAPSVARARSASERAGSAASAALVAVYPRLDLQARYTRLSDQGSVDIGGQADVVTRDADGNLLTTSTIENFESTPALLDQFMLQASVSYGVSDLFFSILPRYEASKEAARAEDLNIQVHQQSVALAARVAYYNYARVRAALLVADSALAQSEAHRRDVVALVGAGAVARVELMRADAAVAAARVAQARTRGSVAVARTALRTLLHVDGDEFAIAEDLTQPLPPLKEDQAALIEMARTNRSELRSLRMMAGVYDTLADANGADGYPKLAVAASYDMGNPNARYPAFEREWQGSWIALATLSWSPNDLAASSAREDQARADVVVVQRELDALDDNLRLEVSQAHEDYLAAGAAMEAALVGIEAAEESYRVRREQFRAGAAVATDVIDSEEKLRGARLDLVNAAIDLRIARARIDRAVERPVSG